MRAILIALTLGAFSIIAVPHVAAASTNTQTYRLSGQGGHADFQTISGCLETDTIVDTATTVSRGTISIPPSPGVTVAIFHYDNCTNTMYMAAFGLADATTLQTSRTLSTGAVTATVPMQDSLSNNSFTVSVNVSWTGTGSVFRSVTTSHYGSQGYSATEHYSGSFRDATATGSVSDGTTQWASSPTAYAQLYSLKDGYVQTGTP